MPRDLLQLYGVNGTLTVRTTEDDSRTQLVLKVRHAEWSGAAAHLNTLDVRQLAGVLLQWLADGGHALPDAPAGWLLVEQELEDGSEDEDGDDENPAADSRPPAVQDAGTLTLLRAGDRVTLEDADPWVVVSGSLLNAIRSGRIPGAGMAGDTFTIEDSDGARVMYAQHAPAGMGAVLCRRVSWRPGSPPPVVHVVPEHTRG